ncbi:Ohr family peroxiredoxin [Flavimaricola marinus]|uniref:Organic hydroperoxide resistance protein OhrB n=1 Tax=Flavimaricola marinus TaxID=1819565 RepID=A0A238LKP3_9RHOB|nr:Ohr family peroxiredoxin [Flavimaricola marinus]SMY09440.1 Organic hydroperoxide resistance protein OhrB [Flavimaricola marinus]
MTQSIYTAEVSGQPTFAKSPDGQLDIALGHPVEMGGDGVSGTNPEQLFAAAYIACFSGTSMMVAKQKGLTLSGAPELTCTCALVKGDTGPGYIFDVGLTVSLPGLTEAEADEVVATADAICPISNTLRGQSRVAIRKG